MFEKEISAYGVCIYLSGSVEDIKRGCRKFCLEVGLCVTVTPTTFIYTGGEEAGAIVGLTAYPRFPETEYRTWTNAEALAKRLVNETFQHSVLLTDGIKTKWITKREEGDSSDG